MFSDGLAHSSLRLKAMQRKAKCCFYCKKPGHLIRSCRYKRRRDKARKLKAFLARHSLHVENSLPLSLSATNLETTCCSLVNDTETATLDFSMSSDLEDSKRTELPCDLLAIEKNLLNLHSESDSVIYTHHDSPSTELKKYSWNENGRKYFSLSWLFSQLWLRNPFCMTRCKEELLWLISLSWFTDLLSFFFRKHDKVNTPHMVAYCTIGSSQPMNGIYKVQNKTSVPTWKRRKKKRR